MITKKEVKKILKRNDFVGKAEFLKTSPLGKMKDEEIINKIIKDAKGNRKTQLESNDPNDFIRRQYLKCIKEGRKDTIQSIRDVLDKNILWLQDHKECNFKGNNLILMCEELLSQLDDVSLNNSSEKTLKENSNEISYSNLQPSLNTSTQKGMSSMALEMGKYVDSKLETSNTCICGQRLMCKKCWEQHLCLRGCPNFINSLNCQRFKPKDKTLGEVKHG